MGNTARSDGRSRRQSREQTRRMLLSTGRELLMENGWPEAVDIRLADVLKAHDLTTGAGYNIWRNQTDFQQDLALFIASDFEWASADLLGSVPDESDSFEDLIFKLSRKYFMAFVQQEEFYVSLRHFGVKQASPELRQAVNDGYEASDKTWREFLELALALTGRTLRPGVSIRNWLVGLTAVTEGLALRWRFAAVDEQEAVVEQYGHSMLALIQYYSLEPVEADPAEAAGGPEASDQVSFDDR